MYSKNHHSLISLILLGGFLLLGFPGCSSTPDAKTATPDSSSTSPISGTDEQIFVGDSLEMNYDPNVIMKRAEAFHEKEGYPEAIVEYQHFLDLHRNHVLAPYAQYRLALSHFKMIKTIDRDVHPIQLAKSEFQELMDVFPGSRYEAEARVKIRDCNSLLAQHHLFVGKFYYRKEAYLAAANRFKLVIEAFPSLEDQSAEAKYQLARTYHDLGASEWSRDWLVALVQDHPQHSLHKDGMKMLASLQREHPELVVAQYPANGQNPLLTSFLPLKAFGNPSSPKTDLPSGLTGNTPEASVTHCTLGSWCETSTPATPTPSSALPSSPATTCRPGTWCE